MALLYDMGHLQNLVIVGFHVLNPTETPSIQKIKYRHLATLRRSRGVNQSRCGRGDASFPTGSSLFPNGQNLFKLKMATVTQ